ncbi:amino acid permease [Lactobacillus sp. DCY120]|uniref:Amino acid permease n=1 Tax=Bombilactobacillus apium TaxID=2675299 RepID=A0A850R7K2_9LACO|nr:APC family permease [Bombilactobacillus apium]NVY96652.1 amino acid permease [Bombilactobacillus apium]
MNNKDKLGFASVLLFGINGIIGSGIFLLPGAAAKLMGPASIFVLLFDAFLVITIALSFAQAASFFDRDGGPYLYAQAAFGKFVGFEVGFVTWAVRIIAEATMAVAFTTALGATFPALKNATAKVSVITCLIVGLALMNIAGVRLAKVVNNIITISKLIPLVLFIAIGIFWIQPQNFTPLFPGGSYHSGNFAQAAITLFYAFTGFEGIVVAAGDIKDAPKNLPRALLLIMLTVVSFYILIQVVCIGILGNKLGSSNAPIQAAFTQIGGRLGNAVVASGTLLSTGGLLVASSYITPRSGVALAENKMMPQILAWRNQHHAPWVAILTSMVLTLAIAWSGTFSFLAQISAISRFAQYIPTCLAILVFARQKSRDSQKFHLPWGPVIPVVAILVSCWLLIQVPLIQLLFGLGALIVAIPFYLGMTWQKKHAA